MKCRICRKKAAVKLPSHNTAFCKEDYLWWFQKNFRRTVKRFRMFKAGDRVLVGVSGGKDSLALWRLLVEIDLEADGLYIAQGIGHDELPYSDLGEDACREMAGKLGRPLKVVRVLAETGASVPELEGILRRKICSSCGLTKRYLMNREALEGGYDVLATGHNLDDEIAMLFANVLTWDLQRLAHQSPVSPQRGPKLIKKVKPLCHFSEREVLAYTMLSGIRTMREDCPHARGATSIKHKELFSRLERDSPGSKRRFYKEFLRNREIFEQAKPPAELAYCHRCAMPTTNEVCSYCRLLHRVAASKEEVHDGPPKPRKIEPEPASPAPSGLCG